MDNARRAKTFEKAIETYGTGKPQEILVDLMTDAQHWADANGEDFHISLSQWPAATTSTNSMTINKTKGE